MITWWREIAIVAALALAGVQTVRLADGRAENMRIKAAHADVLRDLAERSSQAATKAQQFQTALQQAVAAVDSAGRARLKEKEDANTKLAADVATGRQRLRVRAVCPAAPAAAGVPSTAATAGLDDGATAELAPAARSDYFTLSRGLDTVTEQLVGLQAYVAAGCKAP